MNILHVPTQRFSSGMMSTFKSAGIVPGNTASSGDNFFYPHSLTQG